ncbi:MAG: hypothetical protein GWN47_09335 [Woeseiaceae bacterium]|nr:hypothetical protein [Woeseiaceae bacterium]
MGNPLRDRRTPQELAASGQVIEIADKISDFGELSRIVGADLEALDPDKLPPDWRDADVVGQLSFGFADAQERLPALEGEVAVTIDAVCQRCLEPMKQPLAVTLRLLFGKGGPDAVEDGYEVWEMDEERLRPLDLVEEVLIMAMPLATLHDSDAACATTAGREEAPGSTTRPFADLKSQMEKDN